MFFTYLRRELRRRRKAALVVASGLALGIALVIVVTSVSSGMKQAQDEVLQSLYGLGTDMTVTKAPETSQDGGTADRPRFRFDAGNGGAEQSSDRLIVQGFQSLDDSAVGTVARQDGVADAVGGLSLVNLKISGEFQQGELQRTGPGGGAGGAPGTGEVRGGGADFRLQTFTVYGTDVTHPGLGPLTSSTITEGRTFTAGETEGEVAVVDSAYARQEDLSVGGTVKVKGKKFEVIGIATADSGSAAANVYIPLAPAQALADAESKVTTVYVRAEDSQAIGAVKSAVLENVPGTTVTTSEDLADTVSGSLSTASDLAVGVGRWLSVAVLATAFLVAGLLTSSAVSRRVREFGTLKALGWKSGRVTRQVVGEALVNGLLGGVLGIALGLAGAYLVTAVSPTLTAELGTGAPGAGPAGPGMPGPGGASGPGGADALDRTLDIALTAPVSASTIGIAVALAVTGGLIAGAFGGWRAARLRPADALRRVA
jgi:ABC-type antimicrobial peptide transport system permease subunit